MDNTIDTLQIEIESSTTGSQRGITKLKNSLEKLAKMSEGISKISGEGVSKLKAMADGVEALGNAGNNPGLSKAISELRKLSKLDFSGIATGSDKIKEIADAVDGQLANQKVDAPTVETPAFGQTVDILPGSEVAEKQRTILDFFKSIGKVMAGNVMKSVQKATSKVQQFTKSLARIAMYRVVRMLLHQIANTFKEGTNNCYQYSKAIGGSLATSMDSMASSMLYFKNSIGAMVAPLLNALAPAIEYVIDKVVALINALNQLFAKLTGASTWTKAIKTQTEYAESAGGAANAAKSLTAGFDELNVLSDSGGGGGASTPGYSSMFEEMQLDNTNIDWSNLLGMLTGMGALAGGLTLLFGSLGTAIGLIVGGIVLITTGIKDAIDGSKTLETTLAVIGGIMAVAGGIAILIVGWIPLVVGAVVAAVAAIVIYWDEIKAFFGKVWEGIVEVWGKASDWFDTNVITPVQTAFNTAATAIGGFFTNLWTGIKYTFNGVANWFKTNVTAPIGNFFKGAANVVIDALNALIRGLNKISVTVPDWVADLLGMAKGSTIGFNIATIPRLAEGGFVDSGQLFIAREAGAEMVGNIGGRTAVANNDQIVEGIREGVISAIRETQNSENGSFDIKVYLDGKQITNAVEKRQQERGATLLGGGLNYAY